MEMEETLLQLAAYLPPGPKQQTDQSRAVAWDITGMECSSKGEAA
ncbi:phosphatidylinositol 4-kinase [Aspergillus luchuensis]|uniref:Phosphatidylinositol 4-kinase n=1 Tax=Aspergillus kawachii TaxID=1069201 RepID=A0A146F2W8_ASPKA|nr:phosphatidylinositol 4-kinase [Aspergillus luchuensis]